MASSFGPKYQRKNLTNYALESKSGKINKIKALSYNTIIYIWLYGLFNVLLKTLQSAFILWFDHFSNSRAEFVKFFRWYFGPKDDTKMTFWNYLTFTMSYLANCIRVNYQLVCLNLHDYLAGKSNVETGYIVCRSHSRLMSIPVHLSGSKLSISPHTAFMHF